LTVTFRLAESPSKVFAKPFTVDLDFFEPGIRHTACAKPLPVIPQPEGEVIGGWTPR
jgi:hypothetical protein